MNGDIDLCISSLPIDHLDVHCEPIVTEEIFLAVPGAHRLAERKSIELKEMADEPLIYYTTECGLREITNSVCRQAAFIPNIAFECTTPEVICGLVRSGLGSAFLPAFLWDIMNTDGVAKLHIETPACRRTMWLSWMNNHYLSMAARDFSRFVIDYFSRSDHAEH